MFRPSSGRPGTHFAYTLPGAGAGAAPRPAAPLVFRAPAPIPAIHHPIPEPSKCRLDGRTIIDGMGAGVGVGVVGGGMAGGPPGAVAGILPGFVGGAIGGAYQAISEKKKCINAEDSARIAAYRAARKR
jgi:hypothetical protein